MFFVSVLAVALVSALEKPAWSLPAMSGQLAGWTDSNGNGSIDCGELVTLRVAVFDNSAAAEVEVTGTVTVPSGVPAARWTYVGGSARLDPVFHSECGVSGPLPVGSGPNDRQAVIPFSCRPADTNYVAAFLVDGYYVSSTPGPIVVETVASVGGSNLSNTIAVSNTLSCPAPADLRLTKTAQGSGAAGASLVYTLAVSNPGNGPAAGAAIREAVPAGTAFDPATSSPGWSCLPDGSAGSTCTLGLGSIAPNASLSRTFGVRVSNPLPAGLGTIRNTACATTASADSSPGNDCGSVENPALGTPDLAIGKALSGGSGLPGALLAYTLTARNLGTRDATGVVITESVPPYTAADLGAGSPGWSCTPSPAAGGQCSLALGPLGAGVEVSRTFAVRVASPLPAGAVAIDNTACLADDRQNGVDPPGNNCASLTVPALGSPDLSLLKVLESGSAVGGGILTYRLDLRNAGNRGALGVVLSETVPAGGTFDAAASSPGWACLPSIAAGGNCTLPLGTVEAGQAVSRTFAVRLANPLPAGLSAIENTACASGGGPLAKAKGLPCSTVLTPTGGNPDLELEKSGDRVTFAAGEVLGYSLSVRNGGTRTATGVTLVEVVPAATAAELSASSPGWSCSPSLAAGSTCTLPLPSLAPGAGATAAFAVRVASPLPAGTEVVQNTACVTEDGSNGFDPEANDCSTVSTPRTRPRMTDLSLSLGVEAGLVAPGERGRFALRVDNSSQVPAHGVRVLVYLPVGTEEPAEVDPRCWVASERALECTLGTLEAGADESVTWSMGGNPGHYVVNAEVTACEEPDRDSVVNNADPAEDDWGSVEFEVSGGEGVVDVPALHAPGLVVLGVLLPLAGWSVLRRRRSR